MSRSGSPAPRRAATRGDRHRRLSSPPVQQQRHESRGGQLADEGAEEDRGALGARDQIVDARRQQRRDERRTRATTASAPRRGRRRDPQHDLAVTRATAHEVTIVFSSKRRPSRWASHDLQRS